MLTDEPSDEVDEADDDEDDDDRVDVEEDDDLVEVLLVVVFLVDVDVDFTVDISRVLSPRCVVWARRTSLVFLVAQK